VRVHVIACLCNARIVEGHAGEGSSLPLLFFVPIVLLLLGLTVFLVVRRGRRRGAGPAGPGAPIPSGAGPREPVEAVEEPFDVPGIVEPVGVHANAGRDEQADVHAPFP
jgi:hypothetical protein